MEMVTMTGNLASNIKTIVQNANGFSKFVDSYGRYVNHFIKFKDAVNQFDRENLKLTNDIFNGLTYLAKTDNAIEEMGEQLTGAIKKLADMIQEAKTTIQSSGESSTGAMQAVGEGVSTFTDKIGSFFGMGDDKPSATPAAAPKVGTPAAAVAAANNNGTEITALVTALEDLISKFNDASGASAPFVRVVR
jgi:methyl-accepting chemotaxis protein